MLADHRTGCRVQVFSLILDSSVGLSASIQSAGDLVSETQMGSNPAFSRGRRLVSFRFEYTTFTKSMETQIHVWILTLMFPSFTILLILPIGNILYLLHTKYQALLSNILKVMAIDMTEGWIPKSALSLFELKSTFFICDMKCGLQIQVFDC